MRNTNDGKIQLHQIYFWIGAALLLIQILVVSQIKGSPNASTASRRTGQLKCVISELLHNKKFLSFVGVAIFFYVTWHVDWTLYFIGQVNYLRELGPCHLPDLYDCGYRSSSATGTVRVCDYEYLGQYNPCGRKP